MQYLGGKTRIAKQLAAEIDKVRRPGQLVWDAFCGGLSMTRALLKNGPVLSTDACAPLIALYRAVQAGWMPPDEVSKEQYRAAKLLPDSDPMKAFCGFGCSFGGKWFGGYGHGRYMPDGTYIRWAETCKRALARDVRGAHFGCLDFMTETPRYFDGLIYADVPYRGTTSYSKMPDFDHDAFWAIIERWSTFVPVFVSEYSGPADRICFERPSPGGCGLKKKGAAVERLFYLPKQNAPEPTSSGAYHPTNLPTEEES